MTTFRVTGSKRDPVKEIAVQNWALPRTPSEARQFVDERNQEARREHERREAEHAAKISAIQEATRESERVAIELNARRASGSRPGRPHAVGTVAAAARWTKAFATGRGSSAPSQKPPARQTFGEFQRARTRAGTSRGSLIPTSSIGSRPGGL